MRLKTFCSIFCLLAAAAFVGYARKCSVFLLEKAATVHRCTADSSDNTEEKTKQEKLTGEIWGFGVFLYPVPPPSPRIVFSGNQFS